MLHQTKLTLTLTVGTYNEARALHRHLYAQGFNSGVSSPSNGVWNVLITVYRDSVNIGETIWDELQVANVSATSWLSANASIDWAKMEINS